MKFLKTLPLAYQGELHHVHLINFSVDPDEIRALLPEPLKPQLFQDRALISLVNVQLRNMRPQMASWLRFHYRHVGFRLLVQDHAYHQHSRAKGVFFLRSFTDKPLIVTGGKLMTNFRLENAQLTALSDGLLIRKQDKYLRYEVDPVTQRITPHQQRLKEAVRAIDRAYAVMGNDVYMTRILRDKWPLQPLPCPVFRTNFFESARLEGVFRVPESIEYTWLAPQKTIPVCALSSSARVASSVA